MDALEGPEAEEDWAAAKGEEATAAGAEEGWVAEERVVHSAVHPAAAAPVEDWAEAPADSARLEVTGEGAAGWATPAKSAHWNAECTTPQCE